MTPVAAATVNRPLPAGLLDRLNRAGGGCLILLHRIGRHTIPCAAGLFVLCVGLRMALLRRVPVPQPVIHDEFAYLLGADTFAHGRMVNPTHPLWEFFETMHVLSHPVYASKYQPGQSLFLAFGQRALGNPYFGVVLSCGAMIAALYWMLRAWAPPGWALLGGLFALATFHVNHYWMQSYWGGAVPACGAALVVGAYGRRRASWQLGLGTVLLLLTRPYESSVVILICSLGLLRGRARWTAAAVAITLAGVAFQAFYDWRATGNPLIPPYFEHIRQNQVAPILWVMKPYPKKSYDYPELTNLHGWELHTYRDLMSRGLLSRLHHLAYRILYSLPDPFRGYWMAWLIAVLFPDRKLRQLAWLSLGAFVALMLETWMIPHYEAPLMAVALALMTRLGWRIWHVRPVGPALVVLFAAIYTLPAVAGIARGTVSAPVIPEASGTFPQDRSEVIGRLRAEGGRNVVIVRYSADHSPHREWVYNAAEIDAAPIVWARDRGEDNRRLFEYFKGRRFWLLEPDAKPYRLQPLGR